MGRNKAPFVDIAALALIMRLYSTLHKLSEAEHVGDEGYMDKLSKKLAEDFIIGESSRSQLTKLLGRPYQKNVIDTDGIDLGMLNRLAEKVLDLLPLKKPAANADVKFYWWEYFLEKVANPPAELRKVNNSRYYKFLPEGEKELVNTFVNQRMGELGVDEDMINFLVHFWAVESNSVQTGLLQLNRRTKVINYNFFVEINNDWVSIVTFKKDQSGGEFLLEPNLCYMSLVDGVESTRAYSRQTMYLQTTNTSFYTADIFKGFLIVSSNAAAIPTAYEIVMERQKSYIEAFTNIKIKNVRPEIRFELLNRRFEANNPNVPTLNALRSSKIFKVVKRLEGFYVCGYLAPPESPRAGSLVIGLAAMDENGMVKMAVSHSPEISCFIENEFYRSNLVRLKPQFERDEEQIQLYAYLKVDVDYTKNPEGLVKRLIGKVVGVRENTILGNNIVFIKTADKTFDELKKRVPIKDILIKDSSQALELSQEEIDLKDYFLPEDKTARTK